MIQWQRTKRHHCSTKEVEHAISCLFMVVRISEVLLLVSWLSDGVLQQGLVALVCQLSESIVESSLSIKCIFDSSEHDPSIGNDLASSLRNGWSAILQSGVPSR